MTDQTIVSDLAHEKNLTARSIEVERAYNQIVSKLIDLHLTFKEPHLRRHVQLVDYFTESPQFISRQIDISLSGDKQTIFYGKSSNSTYEVGKTDSTELIMIIFNATAKCNTAIDIEDCFEDQYYHLPEYISALDNPHAKIYLEGC